MANRQLRKSEEKGETQVEDNEQGTEDSKLSENPDVSQEKQNLDEARSRHNKENAIMQAVAEDMVDYLKHTGRKPPVRNCTVLIGDSMVKHIMGYKMSDGTDGIHISQMFNKNHKILSEYSTWLVSFCNTAVQLIDCFGIL